VALRLEAGISCLLGKCSTLEHSPPAFGLFYREDLKLTMPSWLWTAILLPPPPEFLGLQVYATTPSLTASLLELLNFDLKAYNHLTTIIIIIIMLKLSLKKT
jgi:hypothetical protein